MGWSNPDITDEEFSMFMEQDELAEFGTVVTVHPVQREAALDWCWSLLGKPGEVWTSGIERGNTTRFSFKDAQRAEQFRDRFSEG
jgi:hypothetical protein